MRLSSLKLAGFKSFVDSTTLIFPDSRTAVVGPNGCGKSNVIDAIRWVMGESSARQLRGGAMTDVIFAGTAQRKPVGQASVELRFENTLGKLGGEYNAYAELSVRRQVNRDGRSDYFLNGTRCRRRDITDIFLGTGLGPRSYAVIEQGMINRLIDAKPDEMRVYIEEAAGVSRYQARRRETMQHLEHTRQNLSRLQDIDDELQAQMRSLKRQSQAAIKYRELEQQQHTLNVQIWSVHYQLAKQTQQQYTEKLTQLSEQYRQLRDQRHQAEADWQTGSQQLSELLTKAEPMQQHWQQAAREVSQLEHWVQQHEQDSKLRHQQQHQWQQNQRTLLLQLNQDRQQLTTLNQAINENQQALIEAEHHRQQCEQQLTATTQEQQQAEQRWQESQQQYQREQQKQHNMTQQLDSTTRAQWRLEQQIQHINEQLSQLHSQQQQAELDDLMLEQQDVLFAQSKLQQQQATLEQQVSDTGQALKNLTVILQQKQQQQQQDQSEFEALKKLQAQLIHPTAKPDSDSTEQVQILLQQLTLSAEAQPHSALIEKLMGDWLRANGVPMFSTDHADDGSYSAYSRSYLADLKDVSHNTIALTALVHERVIPLQQWVTPLLSCWQAVGIVNTHQDALTLHHQLQGQQSLLSLDGFWLGTNWQLNLNLDESAARQQGILQQQLRQQQLKQQLNQLTNEITPLLEQKQQLTAEIDHHQAQLQPIQHTIKQGLKTLQQLELQRARLETTVQNNQQRIEQLIQQQHELQLSLADDQLQIAEWHMELASVQVRLNQLKPQLDAHQQQLDYCQQQRQEVQLNYQVAVQQVQQLQNTQQHLTLQQQATQQSILRAEPQQQHIEQELLTLEQAEQHAALAYPAQRERLVHHQALAQQANTAWVNWQQQLETRQIEQQRLTELRQQGQQDEDQRRDALEKTRLDWQDCKNKLEQALAHLTELNATPQMVNVNELANWQQQLEKIQQHIQRLGHLNLAAPDALADVSARHDELAHQILDLQQTIEQLEHAMKSIDQETRSLFMQTFDKVNTELALLFPKVFGGGEASLSLESDWQSGVRLMARPPGKRNSSLALLSGGEKALTALALVFAIFRLNPAPFCVLDEVDAPLDDANVQRFCHLVTELSQQVQFIYITHNKLAMTMATDLLGVTMPEAGASRLVAVNIEQAAKFSATSE